MKHYQDSKIFFYLLFGGVLLLTYLIVKPILSLIILALLVAVMFNPVFEKLLKLVKRKSIATTMTLITIILSVVIPVIFVSIITVNQVQVFIKDIGDFAGVNISFGDEETSGDIERTDYESQDRVNIKQGTDFKSEEELNLSNQSIGNVNIQEILDDINSFLADIPLLELEITLDQVKDGLGDIAQAAAKFVGDKAIGFLAETPLFFTNLIVFMILVVALIPTLDKLRAFFIKLSPLDDEIDKLYLKKVQAMSVSMVRGTFVIALVQGIICGLLLLIAGVDYIVFWIILCAILSLIPNGAAIVNWPIVIFLLLSGNIFGAIILIVGNILIVSSVDNVLRPMLVSKEATLPPALTLIGVVGGLQSFGFLGFIYGPVALILLVTTFDIYINHYREKMYSSGQLSLKLDTQKSSPPFIKKAA